VAPKTIEEALVAKGLLTPEQLEQAREEAARNGGNVSAAVVRMKLVADDAYGKTVAELRGSRFVDVTALKAEVMDQLAKLVPAEIAHMYRAIPVGKKFNKFTFAVADPMDPALLRLNDDLFRGKPGEIEFWVTGPGMIDAALEKYFPGGGKKAPGGGAGGGGGGGGFESTPTGGGRKGPMSRSSRKRGRTGTMGR
jgi:hypothetical protein